MPTNDLAAIDLAFDQLLGLKTHGQSKESDRQDQLFNHIGRGVIKDLHRIANALEVLAGTKENKEIVPCAGA